MYSHNASKEILMRILKEYRELITPRLSQTEFAERLDISQAYLANLERCHRKPTVLLLNKLGKYDPVFFSPERISSIIKD